MALSLPRRGARPMIYVELIAGLLAIRHESSRVASVGRVQRLHYPAC